GRDVPVQQALPVYGRQAVGDLRAVPCGTLARASASRTAGAGPSPSCRTRFLATRSVLTLRLTASQASPCPSRPAPRAAAFRPVLTAGMLLHLLSGCRLSSGREPQRGLQQRPRAAGQRPQVLDVERVEQLRRQLLVVGDDAADRVAAPRRAGHAPHTS